MSSLTDNTLDTPRKPTTTYAQSLKHWLGKQLEVAKFAWTVVVIIAGLLGYTASLTPVPKKDGDTVTTTLNNRLANIETTLTNNKQVNENLSKAWIDEQKKLAKDLEDLKQALLTKTNESKNTLDELQKFLNDTKVSTDTLKELIEKQKTIVTPKIIVPSIPEKVPVTPKVDVKDDPFANNTPSTSKKDNKVTPYTIPEPKVP